MRYRMQGLPVTVLQVAETVIAAVNGDITGFQP